VDLTTTPSTHETLAPILRVRGLGVRFGAVRALQGVDFDLHPGEVHALMGENGAGKSTLIRCIGGVLRADEGEITLGGRRVSFASPREAEAAGIATVFQEVGLIGAMSIAENICLGREPARRGWPGLVRWPDVRRIAVDALARLGHGDLDVGRTLGACSVAVQQIVSIARALAMHPRVLILDEPTSSLGRAESATFMRVVKELRGQGLGIVLVTHFIGQAEDVADRVTVLRDGVRISTHAMAGLSRVRLVSDMVGRDVAELERHTGTGPQGQRGDAGAILRARGIGRTGMIDSVDLSVRAGEVVGLAGLLGSGRTETARLLFGVDAIDRGIIELAGGAFTPRSTRDAIASGIALCPENRKSEGVIAGLSVRENIAMALLARRGLLSRMSAGEQSRLAEEYVRALGIKTPDVGASIGTLSGGNQQKALIARWLATGPRLLILDEPTRGIDIAAKADVLAEVRRLAAAGMGVVLISSELEELAGVCDRVVILRDRRSVGELVGEEVSEQALLSAVAGRDG
jgi:simple sugar transport system ATP-binding protein